MRPPAQANLEKRVLSLVNDERRKAGLGRLTTDDRLTAAARGHSADMVRRAYVGHYSPEGTSVADRVTAAGYRWAVVGENIARGQENALQVVAAWMRSRGHRANILSDA